MPRVTRNPGGFRRPAVAVVLRTAPDGSRVDLLAQSNDRTAALEVEGRGDRLGGPGDASRAGRVPRARRRARSRWFRVSNGRPLPLALRTVPTRSRRSPGAKRSWVEHLRGRRLRSASRRMGFPSRPALRKRRSGRVAVRCHPSRLLRTPRCLSRCGSRREPACCGRTRRPTWCSARSRSERSFGSSFRSLPNRDRAERLSPSGSCVHRNGRTS